MHRGPPSGPDPPRGRPVREVGRLGSLLGFLPDVDLADVRFRLAGGDVLLLYTDGATDARPRSADGDTGPLFGQDGLAVALADCADLDAAGVIARLSGILTGHSGDWASDDTALIALRVPPGPARDRTGPPAGPRRPPRNDGRQLAGISGSLSSP